MTPQQIVDAIGYPAAGLGILIESAGVPFPGEIMLVAAAAWAAERHHSLLLVIVFAAAGATAGADIGYYLGWRGGRPFVEKFGRWFRIDSTRIAAAELFFARHGDKAVVASRFAIGLRTWGSMLAGMAHMPFWRFQIFSLAGACLWALVIGLVGYFLGSNWAVVQQILAGMGVAGVAIVVVVILVFVLAQRLGTSSPTR